MSDRTVHATGREGSAGFEIVRYDRAGKWALENAGTRTWLTIEDAVSTACGRPYDIHFGLPGGATFDSRCRARLLAQRKAAGS